MSETLNRYLKPSEPFSQMEENIRIMEQFEELNSSILEGFNVPDCSVGNFLGYPFEHQENPLGLSQNISVNSHFFLWKDCKVPTVDVARVRCDKIEKRKAMKQSESHSEDICSTASPDQSKDDDKSNKKKGSEKKNRRRYKRKEQDKPQEVIHVRAKRGQATDNHSLAERVRREKINNKLKCLKDLVPGCQKTMGLVTVLDEIIGYVHSLKNQVEFLSLELEAAYSNQMSRNKRATKSAQETGSHEAQEMGKWAREHY